jgi:hypothetical protein
MLTLNDLLPRIKDFASEISSNSLIRVYHEPDNEARPSCCFQNVWTKVKKDGGEILFGWTFSYLVNSEYGGYLVATHHAVWRTSEDQVLDVTPFHANRNHHPIGWDNYVVFLPDESAQPFKAEGLIAPLPLKFFAFSENQELRKYVKKMTEEEQKACQEIYKGKYNTNQISDTLFYKD